MRKLSNIEILAVSGGSGECSDGSSGADASNDYLGGASANDVGEVLIATYEGLVAATSHVIERVANAFKD
jgi:hypothetical protein